MLLDAMLRRKLKVGRLRVTYADGRSETYGDGSGAPIAVRVSRAGEWRIVLNPPLGLGEAYMNGDLEFEEGDIGALIDVAARNLGEEEPAHRRGVLASLWISLLHRLRQANDRNAALRNVHHHYDLSTELYRRFLDEDLQYSCAYFPDGDMGLEAAQAAKKRHIAAKLRLEPGMKVLDIGCGWGGLAIELVRDFGVEVLGVTLSAEQFGVAQQRAEAAGLASRARFSLCDYRDLRGPFDRIVSVGMFEHVGAPNYLAFFDKVRDLLSPDGAALIHSIGRRDPPDVTSPFIRKYIFPGGYIPALSEVTAAVEMSGLWITDIEILRLHYAKTLAHWRERFARQRTAIAALYDERFCRMWEFYLAVSEMSFRIGGHMNFQLQLAKEVAALPLARDYMVDTERAGEAPAGRRLAAQRR